MNGDSTRVLVTGGAGFIGSNIVDVLIENGFDVSVVDDLSSGKRENVNPRARFYHIDITSPDLREVFTAEVPRFVIHHAAQIDVRLSVENPEKDAGINIIGSIAVLQNCIRYGVEKVVYASSAAVYGDPLYLPVDEDHPVMAVSPYGISKHTVEHYLQAYSTLYGLKYTVLRYSNVYGPRQDPTGEGGVVAIFAGKVSKGQPVVIYGDGTQTRDFVHVFDVARANLAALSRGDGLILNISTDTETSVNDLYDIIRQNGPGRPAEPIYAQERPGEIQRSRLANARATGELGWKPVVSLEKGVGDLMRSLVDPARRAGSWSRE